jgi:hypothetical protein
MPTSPPLRQEAPPEAGPEATVPWRGFVLRFLGLLGGVLAAVALLNYLVNPESIYATSILPPLTWNTRPEKAALMDRAQPPPQALLLGSSRIMKLDPAQIERRTGLPAFNAGVNVAMAEDYYALLRYAVERSRMPLKRVIIAADVDAFHDHEPTNDYLLQPNALGNYLQAGEQRFRRWKQFTLLFNGYQTKLSLISLWDAVHGRNANYRFEPNGYVHFLQYEAERSRGHYDLDGKVNTTIEQYLRRYQGYTSVSAQRLEYFRKTLAYARDRGIQVDVFLTPAHPRLLAALQQRNYGVLHAQVLEALRRTCAEYGAGFRDLSTLDTFGGRDADFYDGVHPDESNSARIVDALLAPK